MAIRILTHLGLLAEGGRVAILVGSEVVYLPGRGATPATMTPYDVAAVRLTDGVDLAGTPPEDAESYVNALRADRSAGAAALTASGEMTTAHDIVELVERLARVPWAEAEASARTSGALVGGYPVEG